MSFRYGGKPVTERPAVVVGYILLLLAAAFVVDLVHGWSA